MHALSNCTMTCYSYTKAKISSLITLLTEYCLGQCTWRSGRDAGGSDGDGKNPFSSHNYWGHQWSLPFSHSSSRRSKVPKFGKKKPEKGRKRFAILTSQQNIPHIILCKLVPTLLKNTLFTISRPILHITA